MWSVELESWCSSVSETKWLNYRPTRVRAPAASTCTAYPEDQLTVTALWFRLLFSPFLITGSGDMDGLPKVRPTVYLFVCLKNGCSDILFSRYTVIWIFFVVVVCIFLSMVLNYSEQGLLKNFISSLHQLLCLRGDFYQSICSNKQKKKVIFSMFRDNLLLLQLFVCKSERVLTLSYIYVAEFSQQHGRHEQSSRHSAGWRRDGRQLFKPIPKWKCEYRKRKHTS